MKIIWKKYKYAKYILLKNEKKNWIWLLYTRSTQESRSMAIADIAVHLTQTFLNSFMNLIQEAKNLRYPLLSACSDSLCKGIGI